MLDPIAAAVEERAGRELPEALASVEAEHRSLALRGYLAREAEVELFEAARGPMPWLTAQLRDADALTVAARLAAAEPAGRPEPADERSASWRVPGPGGHVRHYLAVGAARTLSPDVPEEEAKRSWLLGFYLRCCEEASAGDEPVRQA